jgi:ribosomal protein S18 acetylase RimI-like enzyme
MNISLRPVQDSDDAFLFELYASTRANELAQVPWTQPQKDAFLQMQFTAQKTSYVAQYPHAQHDVICRDTRPVGRLYLERGADKFHILDITISEASRKEGVGSAVLRGIILEADQAGKPTTIYVESFSPSVRLFERLGFRTATTKEFLVLLQRLPLTPI